MNKKNKRSSGEEMQYTNCTLWTATADWNAGQAPSTQVTGKVQSAFQKSLQQSQAEINKKLEIFNDVPVSKAAALSVIR